MKKKCELCKKVARVLCDSDRASLCWDCDARVHSANFLVAKHVRTLLCHSCQVPTPWTGSGPELSQTLSVCQACVDRKEGDRDDGDRHRGDDDGGENQVVPLSLSLSLSLASNSSVSTQQPSSRRNRMNFPAGRS